MPNTQLQYLSASLVERLTFAFLIHSVVKFSLNSCENPDSELLQETEVNESKKLQVLISYFWYEFTKINSVAI